jgi:hypothetical protein
MNLTTTSIKQASCIEEEGPLANKGLNTVMPHNEANSNTLIPECTTSENEAWRTLSNTYYEKAPDWKRSAVTRSRTVDPETRPTGFFRLISEDTAINNIKKYKENEHNESNSEQCPKSLTPYSPTHPYELRLSILNPLCSHD